LPVTKKDIADYLGISRTAVSLVLNNTPNSTISEETRNNILRAAKELGYRDASVSPKICFILCNRSPEDPLYLSDLKLVENKVAKHDHRLLFMHIGSNAKDYKRVENTLATREIAGVILTGEVDDAILDVLEHSKVPYVVFSSIERPNVNSVEPDVVKVARECTRYLISLGHRNIAYLTGGLDLLVHRKAMEGYRQALEEAGIPFDKSLVQVSKEEDGYELCYRMEMLDIPYTAAFCVNTKIQFGALQRLKEAGVQVPREKSLIGWGMTDFVKMSIPPLTAYYIDPAEKQNVIDRLFDIMKNGDNERKTIYMTKLKLHEGGTASICAKTVPS